MSSAAMSMSRTAIHARPVEERTRFFAISAIAYAARTYQTRRHRAATEPAGPPAQPVEGSDPAEPGAPVGESAW